MQEFLTTYLEPIILFISGGGLATIFTVKYTRKTAEANAMKAVQDVYQETIKDLQNDKRLMKEDNLELRKEVNALQSKVRENSKDINSLKRYKCTVMDCALRKKD